MQDNLKPTPESWKYVESTCTHGGYGKCREGCLVGGIWELDAAGKQTRLIAQPMWKQDIPILAAAPDLLAVAQALDEFQRTFAFAARAEGRMPGNDFYSDQAMFIVTAARAAVAKALSPSSETP